MRKTDHAKIFCNAFASSGTTPHDAIRSGQTFASSGQWQSTTTAIGRGVCPRPRPITTAILTQPIPDAGILPNIGATIARTFAHFRSFALPTGSTPTELRLSTNVQLCLRARANRLTVIFTCPIKTYTLNFGACVPIRLMRIINSGKKLCICKTVCDCFRFTRTI